MEPGFRAQFRIGAAGAWTLHRASQQLFPLGEFPIRCANLSRLLRMRRLTALKQRAKGRNAMNAISAILSIFAAAAAITLAITALVNA